MMNDIIKAGVKTKVLMLSATPVNNKLDDLKNQIAFITEGNDKALRKRQTSKASARRFGAPSRSLTNGANFPKKSGRPSGCWICSIGIILLCLIR
ncbi:hypothetical protein [Geobacillus thermoleovorans]